MARIMFVTDAWSVRSSVASESGGVGANASNMLDINPAYVWETDGAGVGQFTLTGPTGPADTFVLAYCSFTSAVGVWRVVAAANEAALDTTPLIDTGTIPLWPNPGLEGLEHIHAVYHHASVETIGAVRIFVNDPNATFGSFTIGHFMASQAFTPTVNFSHAAGYGFGYRDTSEIQRTPSGRVTILRDPTIFSGSVTMDFLSKSDAHEFDRLSRFYGSSYPVFVIYNIEDTTYGHDQMVHALLQWSDPPVVSSNVVNRFRVTLGLEEMGV